MFIMKKYIIFMIIDYIIIINKENSCRVYNNNIFE